MWYLSKIAMRSHGFKPGIWKWGPVVYLRQTKKQVKASQKKRLHTEEPYKPKACSPTLTSLNSVGRPFLAVVTGLGLQVSSQKVGGSQPCTQERGQAVLGVSYRVFGLRTWLRLQGHV